MIWIEKICSVENIRDNCLAKTNTCQQTNRPILVRLYSTMYLYVDRAENVHLPKFSRMPACQILVHIF